MEKPPEKPSFGSILDKDPELQSDNIKYDIKTIGASPHTDDSFISVVEGNGDDGDYLNATMFSQDPIISQLLGPPNAHPV
jgi:hypothetical protein